MKIHYNNGRTEKLIDNIIAVQVIGNGFPIVAVTKDGREYRIPLDNIEMIIDGSLSNYDAHESAV